MAEMLTERVGCADEAGGVLCAEGERDDEDEDEDDIRAMAVEEKRRRWGERERRAKRPIEHDWYIRPRADSCGAPPRRVPIRRLSNRLDNLSSYYPILSIAFTTVFCSTTANSCIRHPCSVVMGITASNRRLTHVTWEMMIF